MQQRFIVSPHRGQTSSGLWSVRRDGEMVGIHLSRNEAIGHALSRANADWQRSGVACQVLVQEDDGCLREEQCYGPSIHDATAAVSP